MRRVWACFAAWSGGRRALRTLEGGGGRATVLGLQRELDPAAKLPPLSPVLLRTAFALHLAPCLQLLHELARASKQSIWNETEHLLQGGPGVARIVVSGGGVEF